MNELHFLPQFKIVRSESSQLTGLFDSRIYLSNGSHCYLVGNNGFYIDGNMFDYDSQTNKAIFKINDMTDVELLDLNHSYAYLDGYTGELIASMLDETREWKKELFQSQDVVEYTTEKGIIIGKVGQSPTFPFIGEGRIVKDSWDHEHCNICNEKISLLTQPSGFVDQNNQWLCEKCYTNYVESKKFDFLLEEVAKQKKGIK